VPIKDKKRYGPDWEDIRQCILNRAQHCCEFCGIPNYAQGWRDQRGVFHPILTLQDFKHPPYKIIKIVLTIAHLDHMPENNDFENLRALCQRCHLSYDRDSGGSAPAPLSA